MNQQKVTVELSLDELRQLCKEMFYNGQNDAQLCSTNSRLQEMTETEVMDLIDASIFRLHLKDNLSINRQEEY